MLTNCNESTQSCGLYKPHHLREGYVSTIFPQKNNNSKVKNNNVINLGSGESFSKSYVPSTKRCFYNFGISSYFDRKFKGSHVEYMKKIEESTTVYVGNLNLVSTESDVHKLFSKAGNIKTIIMGVEKKSLAPGGFCFVEYETRRDAENCVNIMQGTLLGGNTIFIDWDAGFIEGRQYKRKRNQRSIRIYPSFQKVNSHIEHQVDRHSL